MKPLLNAKGIYIVADPFTLSNGVEYQCTGIIDIQTLVYEGVDVYTDLYADNGLDSTVYTTDLNNNVSIVSLTNTVDNSVYQLPDSYITAMPSVATIPYSRIILSADLGPLPDDLTLDSALGQVSDVLSDVIGISPVVLQHRVSVTEPVTVNEHLILEQNRTDAISARSTPYAQIQHLTDLIAEKDAKIQLLENALISLQ